METRSASTLSIPDSRLSNPRRTRSPPGSGSPSTAPIIGLAAPARGSPALAATLPRVKLTVTVITRNEAAHIERALASVAWADEIVVVDSGSTDDTVAIARRLATRVEVARLARLRRAEELRGGASHRTTGSCRSTPTSGCTPELAAEIRARPANSRRLRGYRIPRVTWYLGRWIRAPTGIRTTAAALRSPRRRVERAAGARVGRARTAARPAAHELQHYAYRDISHHLATIDRYTTLAAEQWTAEGRRTSALAGGRPSAARVPAQLRAARRLRDGAAGLLVSALNSYYVFLKFAKLWELQQQSRRAAADSPQAAHRDQPHTHAGP